MKTLKEALEALDAAKAAGDLSARNTALQIIGRRLGAYTDRIIDGRSDAGERFTEDQWRAIYEAEQRMRSRAATIAITDVIDCAEVG